MRAEKFKMWRLALSFIHADGVIDATEELWFRKKIYELKNNSVLGFTEQEIADLEKVFHVPVKNFLKEFEEITSPADASFLLYIKRFIANLDENICHAEGQILEQIEQAIRRNVDISALEEQVAQMEENSYSADELYKVYNQHSIFEHIYKGLLKFLHNLK